MSPLDGETWTTEALKQYVDAAVAGLERMVAALRATDIDAVKTAHVDLSARLEGFPQQFATKEEVQGVSEVVSRLDKDTLAREVYESNHKRVVDWAQKLDVEKLNSSVFLTYVEEQRRRDDEASRERRAVAAALAARTAEREGATATWRQILGVVGGATAVITLIVLLANHIVF